MKIFFQKITDQPKSFSLQKGDLLFKGNVKRVDRDLYKIVSSIEGSILVTCCRTGEEFFREIEENLTLYISNGIWDIQSQDKSNGLDVIEFFEGFIDFEYILQSEISSIQMQYHVKQGGNDGCPKKKSE